MQKGIGHSPQEVTAALSSSDKQIVSGMKEIMRQFQTFLAHFEVKQVKLHLFINYEFALIFREFHLDVKMVGQKEEKNVKV